MYRGIDVSQVKYARIENVCIYRRADSTGSAIYVCMHAYIIGASIYTYILNTCIFNLGHSYTTQRADQRAD